MKRWLALALLIFIFPLEVGFTYAVEKGLAARWAFDEAKDSYALDAVKNTKDELIGYSKYLPGISGQALQLDGYTTRIIRKAGKAPRLSKALTVQAWIAVQAYPWNWNAIITQAQGQKAGYFFGIDQDGRVALKMAVDGAWQECVSQE